MAPFAAVAGPGDEAQRRLHGLLASGESLWIASPPSHPGLVIADELDCVQMVLPPGEASLAPPGSRVAAGAAAAAGIVPVSGAEAAEVVAVTDVAFPGFFRPATHRMGSYAGIRVNGQLVAMAGERLRLEGFPELSGICTHPQHRGRGLAAALISHRVRAHRRMGMTTWLHVGAPNIRAIELYKGLGFKAVRNLMLRRIMRID